jgi:uncharacterized membrane protein
MLRGILWTLWNLFLASLPVFLGRVLGRTPPGRLRAVTFVTAAAWLLLLPNTSYLMTEWRHFLFDDHFVQLREHGQADRAAMFETAVWGLLFAGYTATGAVLFTLALRPVAAAFRRRGWSAFPWAPTLFLLVALGVYVGLFDRLNSWDALKNPGAVVERCLNVLARPTSLVAISGFAVVLFASYVVVGYVIDGLAADLARLRARRRETSTASAAAPSPTRDQPASLE